MSQFVRSQSGAYRAEMDLIQAAELNYFAEFRKFPASPSVPVFVLLANRLETQMWAGRPCVPAVCRDEWMRQRIRALKLLTPPGRDSAVTLLGRGRPRHTARSAFARGISDPPCVGSWFSTLTLSLELNWLFVHLRKKAHGRQLPELQPRLPGP
jgi:hypothetical protein